MGDPDFAWIAYPSPPTVIGNAFLAPSNRLEKSSRTSSSPRVHILNSSSLILSIVNWNSLNVPPWTVGIPTIVGSVVVREVGTVNTWAAP